MTANQSPQKSLMQDERHGELETRLRKAGCFAPARKRYAARVAVILVALVASFVALLDAPEWPVRAVLISVLAVACVQAAFIAHDVGDGALMRNKLVSGALRQLLLTFTCGTSSTYFYHLHHLHHLSLERLQREGSKGRYLSNKYELHWLKSALAGNGALFLIGTTVLRGFTFRLESLRFVLANPSSARADRWVLAIHYLVWLGLPVAVLGAGAATLNLALLTLAAGAYIGVVLILNHEGMSRVDDVANLLPVERILATTRNLRASSVSEVLLGGVNNHIEHHLFPDMPTMHLAEARKIIKKYCQDADLSYSETSIPRAIKGAFKHFRTAPRERLVREALS